MSEDLELRKRKAKARVRAQGYLEEPKEPGEPGESEGEDPNRDMTEEFLGIQEGIVKVETPAMKEARERAQPARIAADVSRAAGRGALEGISLGQAERLESLARSAFSDEEYSDIIKKVRQEYGEDAAEFPMTYMAGSLAGGMTLPGGIVLKGARKLKSLVPFFKAARKAAPVGKIAGAKEAVKAAGLESLVELSDTEGNVGDFLTAGLSTATAGILGGALNRGTKNISLSQAKKVAQELKDNAKVITDIPPSVQEELRKVHGIDIDSILKKATSEKMIEAGVESPARYLTMLERNLKRSGDALEGFMGRLKKTPIDTQEVADDAFSRTRNRLKVEELTGPARDRLDELEAGIRVDMESLKDLIKKEKRTPKELAKTAKLKAKIKKNKNSIDRAKQYGFGNLVKVEALEELEKKIPKTGDVTDLIRFRQDIGDIVKNWAGRSDLDKDTGDSIARELTLRLSDSIDDVIEKKAGKGLGRQYKNLRKDWRENLVLLKGLGKYKGMRDKVFNTARRLEEDGSGNIPVVSDVLFILGDPMHRGRAAVRSGARFVKKGKADKFSGRIAKSEEAAQKLREGLGNKSRIYDPVDVAVKGTRSLGSILSGLYRSADRPDEDNKRKKLLKRIRDSENK